MTSQDALRRFKAQRTIEAFKAAQVEPPCDECDEPDPVTAAAKGDIAFHGHAALWDVPSGDGRKIRKGGIMWDLETEGIPIIWDRDEGDHSGMVLGKIDTIEDDGIGPFVTGRLFATKDPIAKAAVGRVVELIKENALGWSVALDAVVNEITVRDPEVVDMPDGSRMVRMAHDDDMAETISSRLRHLAIVDTPAQPGARPILGPAAPIAAAAILMHAFPAAHFETWPESRDYVPVQVDLDGRVWGHAAGGSGFRNGTPQGGQKYTRDPDPHMRNFHTGTVTLDSGDVIRVGTITAGGPHAPTHLDFAGQQKHHDNSSTVAAKVRAWNDSQGRLCIAGSMIPGLDPSFAAQVAGLPISPEIWPAPGTHGITLVGLQAVPLPAWPVFERA